MIALTPTETAGRAARRKKIGGWATVVHDRTSIEPIRLACSADGTHPLTDAIEGRFVSDLASSPPLHSASGFVGFLAPLASSVAWAGPRRVFVDWIAGSSL